MWAPRARGLDGFGGRGDRLKPGGKQVWRKVSLEGHVDTQMAEKAFSHPVTHGTDRVNMEN